MKTQYQILAGVCVHKNFFFVFFCFIPFLPEHVCYLRSFNVCTYAALPDASAATHAHLYERPKQQKEMNEERTQR